MMKTVILFCLAMISIVARGHEAESLLVKMGDDGEDSVPAAAESDPKYFEAIAQDIILHTIEKYELSAAAAEKLTSDGVVPAEEVNKHYDEMVEYLDEILKQIHDNSMVHNMLKAKGLKRIFLPALRIDYAPLRSRLLLVLKNIFNSAPITTREFIPTKIIDRLLDIFEVDDDLITKARIVEILALWIPNNPNIQMRIMKKKGLIPFFAQIPKLDTPTIQTMFTLFNEIIKEHERVLDVSQKTLVDYEQLKQYERIGLLQQLSTRLSCRGFLMIFERVLMLSQTDDEVMVPIFELIKLMKPYCLHLYSQSTKPINIFKQLMAYVQQMDKIDFFTELGVNMTEVHVTIGEYVDNVKHFQDEL